jgi:IclR family acetate operon transcriptional repressor
MPLHATAAGKCYLAHQPEEGVAEYIDAGLEALTSNTITCPDRLRRELAAVRARGYAVSREESVLGVCGIAVPVIGAGGTVSSCLSLSPLADELVEDEVSEWVTLLRGFAFALSNCRTANWRESLTGPESIRSR